MPITDDFKKLLEKKDAVIIYINWDKKKAYLLIDDEKEYKEIGTPTDVLKEIIKRGWKVIPLGACFYYSPHVSARNYGASYIFAYKE